LSIEFEATKYKEGSVLMALYDSEDTHMEKPFKTAKAKFVEGKAVITVDNLPAGEYSFSYFHDLDGDDEIDKNMMGIPKEPYGFSNGQSGTFGPPSYSDSKIMIEKNTNLNITVK
jgi:uncharacterized protein (DUF2141 family)